jgi:integrase
MARLLRDTSLESREARLRLKARKKPYWRLLEAGRHLGYYKGTRGGTWVARAFAGKGRYHEIKLGMADDASDADGVHILNFRQAQVGARAWCATRARIRDGLEPQASGPYTVTNVLEDYERHYQRQGRGLAMVRSAINTHIKPALGEIQATKLTTQRLETWLHDLADSAPMIRPRLKTGERKTRALPATSDGKRRRRATANRVLTVLKAALNRAWQAGKVPSDEAWRRVKPFRGVDAPLVRYLTEEEVKRLVNASAPDLRALIRAALLTGCRYGELTRLCAADFNPDAGTLLVRESKSGRPRHAVLTEEGQQFFSAVAAGKPGDTLLFQRANGEAWKKTDQRRPILEACKAAKIRPAIGFHVLRHTYGSTLAMRGTPLAVIAKQLGHADTRMTERHYAHLSPSYVADTIRANMPALGIVDKGNVVSLPAKSSS